MKINLVFLFVVLLMSSCVYDPPRKGMDIWVHNQTDKPLILLDSLSSEVKMFDTAKVNNRIFIERQGNYMAEYTTYEKFYSETIIDSLKLKNQNYIRLCILDENHFRNDSANFVFSNPYRYFDFNIDTVKKYELNHLFIYKDTILFEHKFDYYSSRK